MISPFREVLFSRNFAYAKFHENETLQKITEFTVVLETGIDMLASIALTHLRQMDFPNIINWTSQFLF